MATKIAWEFIPKRDDFARLHLDEKLQIKDGTRAQVIKELAKAGIEDSSMLPANFISFTDLTIHLTKWGHYKWNEVCPVVENILKQFFNDAVFEDSKSI